MTNADYQKRLSESLQTIYDTVAPDPDALVFGDPTYADELGIAFEKAQQALTALCRDVCGEARPEMIVSNRQDEYWLGRRAGYTAAVEDYQATIQAILGQPLSECPACSQNIPASKTAVGQVEKLCAKHKSELDSHLTAILGQPQEGKQR